MSKKDKWEDAWEESERFQKALDEYLRLWYLHRIQPRRRIR